MENKVYEKSRYGACAEDWNDLKWIIKAKSKEKNGYGTHYIWSNGKRIVSVDGHRLHTVKLNDNPGPGVYDVIESKDKIVLTVAQEPTFPDWLNAIPKHRREVTINIVGNAQDDHIGALSSLIRSLPADRTINLRYFADIMFGSGYWKVSMDKDGNSPILFRNGKKLGLVMPFKLA